MSEKAKPNPPPPIEDKERKPVEPSGDEPEKPPTPEEEEALVREQLRTLGYL